MFNKELIKNMFNFLYRSHNGPTSLLYEYILACCLDFFHCIYMDLLWHLVEITLGNIYRFVPYIPFMNSRVILGSIQCSCSVKLTDFKFLYIQIKTAECKLRYR